MKEMNLRTVACLLFVYSVLAVENDLCPRFPNCTCLEDNAKDKILIKCRGIEKMSSLQSVFAEIGFRPVSKIWIFECSADSLDDNIFTNSSIGYLVSKCPLSRMGDHSLTTVVSLTMLDMRYMKFPLIPQAIQKLTNLKVLHLIFGALTHIGNELRNMPYLNSLILNDNCIVTVSKKAFINNVNLININLKRNRIKFFHPGTFERCRSLKIFSIEYNMLEFFTGLNISQSLKVSIFN